MRISGLGRESLKIENVASAKKKRIRPVIPSISTNETNEEIFLIVFNSGERFRRVRVVPDVMEIRIKTLKVIMTATYDLLTTPRSLL